MTAVYQWVSQIILLIMLAIVLDMLLPNANFQRYVKMVIGLVLIVALLSPVMALFKMPAEALFRHITAPNGDDPLKSSLETKKKEIETETRAYIHNQMAVQLKNYAEEELMRRFHYTIVSIDVTVDDDHPEDPVKKVAVVLGQAKSDSKKTFEAVQPIEAVRVNVSKDSDASEEPGAAKRMEDVRNFLAKTWGVRPERIAVRSEEGGRG